MNEYKKDRPTSEQLVDLLDNELEITIYADVVHGLDYEYKQLQEENKKLNGAIQTYDILLKANTEENKKLKDNWNKLKEYIDKTKIEEFEKAFGKRYGKTFTQAEIIICNMILDKMQELQGSDSDE